MTKILAFAGRKQSGKSSAANFVVGMELLSLGFVGRFKIDEQGQLVVPALVGNQVCEGIFDLMNPTNKGREVFENDIWPHIKVYNFADTLKQTVCIELLGLTHEQAYGTDAQKDMLTEHLFWENMPGNENLNRHPAGPMSGRQVMQYVGTEIFRKMVPNVWVNATLNKIEKEGTEFAIIGDCRFPNEADGILDRGGMIIHLTKVVGGEDTHASETALDNYENYSAIIDNHKMDIAEKNSSIYSCLEFWEWNSCNLDFSIPNEYSKL